MNTVEVIEEKELKYRIIDMMRKLREITTSGDLIMSGHVLKDPVQKLLVNFSRDSWFDKIIIPIIEVNAIDCEKHAPGSGKLFLDLVVNDLENSIRKNLIFNLEDSRLKNVLEEVDKMTTGLCHQDDYFRFIDENVNFVSRDIINRAIDLYRMGDHIVVEKNMVRATIIDKKLGYVFDNITVHSGFCHPQGWKRNNVNVLIVDGIIESVGEIHHLLEKAHETQESYLIICSGILPEPLSVIQTNFSRKTIDVVVGTVNSNEFSIQTMVDIGTCCLVEPISALKGDTISRSSMKEMVKVERIEVFPNKIIINNPKAKEATDSLLIDVIKRSEENTDVEYLYQKRVKSLISSTIKVSIGRDDVDRDRNIVEDVDLFFRTTPMVLKWGFVKKNDLEALSDDILDLLFGRSNVQPTFRIKKALEAYLSFREQVNRTGAAITHQKE